MIIKQMRFAHPVLVGGRPVESLSADGHVAEFADGMWLRVYHPRAPKVTKLTPIFNCIDADDFMAEKAEEKSAQKAVKP